MSLNLYSFSPKACGDWASTVFTRYLFVGLEERLSWVWARFF